MQSTEIAAEGLRRTFRVVIPATDINAVLETKLAEVRPKVELKGFRKGKVPISHIRKLYGPAMMREIIDDKVQAATEAAIGELRTAGDPKLTLESDINAVVKGGVDLAYNLEVELIPDFDPIDPRTLTLEKLVVEITDSELDPALKEIAENNRPLIAKDGPADVGDVLSIDFVGRIDGEVFEGGSAEGADLEIGSNRFIPGFETQLVGAVAGEERVISVTFPEAYPVDRLKGRDATFAVTVQAVQARAPTAIDDALAQRLGLKDLATLKDAVRRQIEGEDQQLVRAKLKRVLFDQLDIAHTFELPPGMVAAEFEQIWAQVSADIEEGELDPEDKDKTEDELRADYRKIAERRVRLGLVLAEIGRRAQLQIREDEVLEAVRRQASRFPGSEQQVFDFYRSNAQAMNQIRAPLYEDKVVDYILELATVQERKVSREVLKAEAFEGEAPSEPSA